MRNAMAMPSDIMVGETLEEYSLRVQAERDELSRQFESLRSAIARIVQSNKNNTGYEPSCSCLQRDIDLAEALSSGDYTREARCKNCGSLRFEIYSGGERVSRIGLLPDGPQCIDKCNFVENSIQYKDSQSGGGE